MNEIIKPFRSLLDTFGHDRYIHLLVVTAATLLLAIVIDLIISRLLAKLAKKTRSDLDDRIIQIIRKPIFITILLGGVLLATALFKPATQIGWTILATLKTILVLTWSVFLLRLSRILLHHISYSSKPSRLVRYQTLPLFENLALLLILAIAFYLIFTAWHIDMTAWFASAGIAGIAIGFAAKDTLANLFSGVFILADAPYKIGDFVVLESGERGQVTHIGIRSTRLLTRDDMEITIPNSIMGNTKIINESGGPYEKFRIRAAVSIAYGSDIDRARAVLLEVAEEDTEVCGEPEPRVRFRSFGNSGLELELLCWVERPVLRGKVLDNLNTAIYKRFASEGIEIPYSKHDLYIKELPDRGNL